MSKSALKLLMSSRKRSAATGSKGGPSKVRVTTAAAQQMSASWAQHVLAEVNQLHGKLGTAEFQHPVLELVKCFGDSETGALNCTALWRDMTRLMEGTSTAMPELVEDLKVLSLIHI